MGFNIEIKEAVFNKLQSDSFLVSKVKGIYDAVPQKVIDCWNVDDKQFPYVVVGDATINEWDTFYRVGMDASITINVWSRYRGRKQTLELQDIIYDALHRQESNMSVSAPYRITMMDQQVTDSFTDADGKTYHGVQTYRMLIEKE